MQDKNHKSLLQKVQEISSELDTNVSLKMTSDEEFAARQLAQFVGTKSRSKIIRAALHQAISDAPPEFHEKLKKAQKQRRVMLKSDSPNVKMTIGPIGLDLKK